MALIVLIPAGPPAPVTKTLALTIICQLFNLISFISTLGYGYGAGSAEGIKSSPGAGRPAFASRAPPWCRP